ncbi:MAG: ABC transporter permease [Anaerolineales bacterium]|nr:MAG: ABC transporter permease [Anaerolineales bacterium]
MTAFLNHFAFEFRTGIRNRQLLFLNYMFPMVFYLMMGFIMVDINPMFLNTVIPAMVVFAVMAAMLLGIPDPLVKAREDGIFRSYRINGIPSSSILAVPAITTSIHLLIMALIITFTAQPLFNAPLPANWLNYGVVILALMVAMVGISVLIGVVSPSTNFQMMVSQIIFIPSMLVGGLMVPYDILPKAAQSLARIFPATHAMNAFNGLAMGIGANFSAWGSILVLFSGGILAFGLAIYLFNWDSRNETRRGNPALALLVLLPFLASLLLN